MTNLTARAEHEAWVHLCDVLQERGAITDAERDAPRSVPHPVFDAIRAWGRLYYQLRTEAMRNANKGE